MNNMAQYTVNTEKLNTIDFASAHQLPSLLDCLPHPLYVRIILLVDTFKHLVLGLGCVVYIIRYVSQVSDDCAHLKGKYE